MEKIIPFFHFHHHHICALLKLVEFAENNCVLFSYIQFIENLKRGFCFLNHHMLLVLGFAEGIWICKNYYHRTLDSLEFDNHLVIFSSAPCLRQLDLLELLSKKERPRGWRAKAG